MKTITIYTASIVEIDEDKVFAPGRPKTFGWSCTDTDPKALAKRVTDILKDEEKERNGLEIHMPDLPSMESYARYGSQDEPETFETSEDGTRFIVQFSGPMTVEVPDTEAPEETIIAAPAGEEETIDILLSKGQFPNARKTKLEELLEENVFDSREEAEQWLDRTPICLELIYEKGLGLFAAESEAVDSNFLLSPYSGKEILTPDFASDKTTPESRNADPTKEASAVNILMLDWYGASIPYRNVNLSHDDDSDPVVVKVTKESLIKSGQIIDGSPLDDMFHCYVEDEAFCSASDDELEQYVEKMD